MFSVSAPRRDLRGTGGQRGDVRARARDVAGRCRVQRIEGRVRPRPAWLFAWWRTRSAVACRCMSAASWKRRSSAGGCGQLQSAPGSRRDAADLPLSDVEIAAASSVACSHSPPPGRAPGLQPRCASSTGTAVLASCCAAGGDTSLRRAPAGAGPVQGGQPGDQRRRPGLGVGEPGDQLGRAGLGIGQPGNQLARTLFRRADAVDSSVSAAEGDVGAWRPVATRWRRGQDAVLMVSRLANTDSK